MTFVALEIVFASEKNTSSKILASDLGDVGSRSGNK